MFKKLASLVIAAALMVCSVVFTVSAEETDAVPNTDVQKVFHFDIKSAGWESYADEGVYCHIYRADGTGNWPGWQSKAELCEYDKTSGIATYDIQTGIKWGYTDLETIGPEDDWCIIFGVKSGSETYPIVLNSKCYGDTVYVPDKDDFVGGVSDSSDKRLFKAKWRNYNSTMTTEPTNNAPTVEPSTVASEPATTLGNNKDKNSGSSPDSVSASNPVINSGQGTITFFVFGGLMVAAAGAILLLSKKREE